MGGDFRDIDNDGLPDIAYVALQNQTFPLLRNTGKGDFEEITTSSGLSSASIHMDGYGGGFYDLDNDGWKDLFVARGHVEAGPLPFEPGRQPNSIFVNLGLGGKWTALTTEAGFGVEKGLHRGCAFGDFDGDGRIDIVVTALGQHAVLWMNKTQYAGHWIDFRLRGTISNRDGIGATVTLTSKRGKQWNHMTTAVGYASSSDGPIHFGLGNDDHVDAVEITWPSGIHQQLSDLPVDRTLLVEEPPKRALH